MEPAEVQGRLDAHAEKLKRAQRRMDQLAWMIGLYVAKGYHEPKRYPTKPDMVRQVSLPEEDMDEASLKTMLGTYAELHNATVTGGDVHGGNA